VRFIDGVSEEFMARKQRKVTLKAVVKAIELTAGELRRISRATASPKVKKALNLKIRRLDKLEIAASKICRRLNLYDPKVPEENARRS
jgi:hypothetical protein